jgi:glucose-6-phosphate dehydrogenase assembly protein OpcA
VSTADTVWSARDTTPGAIEAALRELLRERHAEDAAFVPARVLNLVVVVDAQWGGEIANRLRGVGRYHPSRTVVCAVEPGRETLDATASVAAESEHDPHTPAPLRELIVVKVGESHLPHLDRIVDPLVVTDLATVVWAPHGHEEGVDALLRLAQVVLCDSVDEPSVADALARARALTDQAYVVDLAWLRSTPWRERVAATFDPVHLRPELRTISRVAVRHHPASGAAALLLVGWLASRLGWTTGALAAEGRGIVAGSATAADQDVAVRLEAAPELTIRGLAGVELETATGRWLRLDRGPGGLRAHYRHTRGVEREWTILGASRGEPGILGEGIRQALLRDPTYAPALVAAERMAP